MVSTDLSITTLPASLDAATPIPTCPTKTALFAASPIASLILPSFTSLFLSSFSLIL